MSKIRVTLWNEFRHEKTEEEARKMYPNGLHATIKSGLEAIDSELEITLASLDEPEQGLPESLLNNTDVLVWWGHVAHHLVDDELVERIRWCVHNCGMGFIALHSAHESKPFRRIVGTSGSLSWGDEQQEIVWNILPNHPIAQGIPEYFELPYEEMYGEPFNIPQPDAVVFGSWYQNGNIFRSGCCFHCCYGKVFYFQPGHETCASFHNPLVIRIIDNAIHWATPNSNIGVETDVGSRHSDNVLEKLGK